MMTEAQSGVCVSRPRTPGVTGGRWRPGRWPGPASLGASGNPPCCHLERGLVASGTVAECVSVVLSHAVWGTWLTWPWKSSCLPAQPGARPACTCGCRWLPLQPVPSAARLLLLGPPGESTGAPRPGDHTGPSSSPPTQKPKPQVVSFFWVRFPSLITLLHSKDVRKVANATPVLRLSLLTRIRDTGAGPGDRQTGSRRVSSGG